MKRRADDLVGRLVRSRHGSPPTSSAAPSALPPTTSFSHLAPPLMHAANSLAGTGISFGPTAPHIAGPNQFLGSAGPHNIGPQSHVGASSSTSSAKSKKQKVLGSLKTLVQIVDKKAEAFAPIGFAMGDLLDCLNTYECEAESRAAYETLLSELEDLFDTLNGQYGGPVPPQMTSSIASLSIGIRKELGYVREKCDRNRMRRYAEAAGDNEDILNCYRRIQRLLNQLSMNANLEMWRIIDVQVAEARLERMPISKAARYNSAESTGLLRGKCTPNTRRNVIGGLHTWVDRPDDLNVYWLNGMAGTGKTTIAYSFCAEREEIHSLGASFFCSRSSTTCSDATRIVPTIAFQLAMFSYPFRAVLCKLLGEVLDICNRDVTTQFQRMIVDTLTNTQDSVPENTVVVLDALDECSNQQEVGLLLDALLKHAPQLPIKFFIASRAEGATQSKMMRNPTLRSVFYLHEVEESFVQEDIELYVTAELSPISPSQDQITQLVQQAGRLFIYAATVIRYVKRGDFDDSSLDRLGRILRLTTNINKIDMLYTTILSTAFDQPDIDEYDRTDMMNTLHAVVCAREPLTVNALGTLLRPQSPHSIQTALNPFHSVLHVSEASGIVTTLHASFPDYLLDEQRARRFYCDSRRENGRLAHACLDLILAVNPPFNICGLASSYVTDEDVPDLEARINRAISPALCYACCYWSDHLEVGEDAPELKGRVNLFLSSHLLVWMEIMNLKKRMDVGVQLLSRAQKWCQIWVDDNALKALTRDAYNFVTLFASGAASLSTPHIYVSMLPFWPLDAPVSVHYRTCIRGLAEAKGTAIARSTSGLLGKWSVGDEVNCLAISPDGSFIVIGTGAYNSNNYALSVWATHTGKQILGPLQGHTKLIRSVAYSPDGAHIVSGSNDKTLRVWHSSTGQLATEPLKGHTKGVSSVAYLPDGASIVSGSLDKTIRVWHASAGLITHVLSGHNNSLSSIAISPDGAFIASGDDDGIICIWDLHTGRMMHGPINSSETLLHSLAYSPDGTHIVSATEAGTIDLWDAFKGEEPIRLLVSHTDPVYGVTYSPDGSYIASNASDGIYIWDARSGEKVAGPLTDRGTLHNTCTYSPDGARIITSAGFENSMICVWDVHSAMKRDEQADRNNHSIGPIAYSPNGTQIVSGSFEGTVCVREARTGNRMVGPFEGHTGCITSVAYAPDGSRIVSGSIDQTLLIWDACTGHRVLGPLKGHTGTIESVTFTPDGSRIVSGSRDQTLRIWHSHTGELVLGPLNSRTGDVRSVVCSPDGAHIASGSISCICVWDASTGRIIQKLEGHISLVVSVAYSHSGQHIASGSYDQTVRIWNAHTGQMEAEPIEWHTEPVIAVAYSPDDTHIVSGSDDGTICVWEARTGDMVAGPFRVHGEMGDSVAFCPDDGTRILSCWSDRTIRVWLPYQTIDMPETEWELTEDGWVVDNLSQCLL